MVDPTTTNIVLSVPVRGSDAGTWDTPVNGDFTILDAVAGSVTTKALTNANVTLTATEAQVAILRFTGTLTGNVIITVSAIRKVWVCENNCLGIGSFTIKISGGSGNVVALPPGSSEVYWDGTNASFVNMGKVGDFWDYIGTAVPNWVTACTVPPYLACDGSTFSAVTYPQLNIICGGTTLPDSRQRARFTYNGSLTRLTAAEGGVNGQVNFAAGGFDSRNIQTSQLPNNSFTPTGTVTLTLGGGGTPITPFNGTGSKVATSASGAEVCYTDPGYSVLSASFASTNTYRLNGNVTQAALALTPPLYVGGITMVRAG